MSVRAIVLDANVLIRAVLGKRARHLILTYGSSVDFFAPDMAFREARKYLPGLLLKRSVDPKPALAVLDALESVVLPLDFELYSAEREEALSRIGARDANDWPVLACALALGCPIWTEDMDFFGTGVATWTTNRVALYLRRSDP